MKRRAALIACAGIIALCGCRKTSDLPDYGVVPEFQLTAQSGAPFNSKSLTGDIWVADFMFTSCPGPCPRMTSQMHEVQQATIGQKDVRFVSFTVDPARDTPRQLAQYAAVHHASPERWSFLTGAQPTLNHLGLDVFKLNRVDGSLQHSTRFVLVDRSGHIRGYYDTAQPESIPKLITDIGALSSAGAAIGVHDLPAINATLNATSAILLVIAFILIQRRKIELHKRVMISAFCVSVLFLVCYIVYHAQVGSVKYPGSGPLRATYLGILFTHTVLAAAVPILAIITLRRGLMRRDGKHRAIARWTLPIWLYVNLTGVVVYLMLYKFH